MTESATKMCTARAKRPDQLRWRLGGLLESKPKQASYAQCAEGRGVLKGIAQGAYAPGCSADGMERAIVKWPIVAARAAELQELEARDPARGTGQDAW